jgi:transposase
MNKTAIARTLGLQWQTVRKYLTYTTAPQRRYPVRPSSVLVPYQASILGRWASGCHNTPQVWREIAAQGSSGGYRTVARLTGSLRRQERLEAALPKARREGPGGNDAWAGYRMSRDTTGAPRPT